jgi:cytochrome c551/c552
VDKAKSGRGKLPSRDRYEKNHPTVSARIPKDKRAKLLSVLQRLGLSLTNLLINIADELEIKLKSLDEARQEGYQKGYEEAKKTFAVTYACGICHKPIAIRSPNAKEAAAKYMVEHRWGHQECHERKRQTQSSPGSEG